MLIGVPDGLGTVAGTCLGEDRVDVVFTVAWLRYRRWAISVRLVGAQSAHAWTALVLLGLKPAAA